MWTEELYDNIYTNIHRVILVETNDPRRLIDIYNTLVQAMYNVYYGDEKKLYDEYHIANEKMNALKKRIKIIDIQAQYIYDMTTAKSGSSLTPEYFLAHNLIEKEFSRSDTSMLVYKAVTNKAEAERLERLMIALSDPFLQKTYTDTSNKPILSGKYIICITYDKHLFSADLLSQIAVISIPLPDEEEIDKEISAVLGVLKKTAESALAKDDDNYKAKDAIYNKSYNTYKKYKHEIISLCKGLTIHEIISSIKYSITKKNPFDTKVFLEAKMNVLENNNMVYIKPEYGFDKVAGMNMLKDVLTSRLILPLKNPQKFKKFGLSYVKGILLLGPPGVGKTYIINALAKETNLPMTTLNPSQIFKKYVGESENTLKRILDIVEAMSPSILFIDEMDSLLRARGGSDSDSGVMKNISQILLTWLGKPTRKTFVIGGTNLAEHIDVAYLRPGRIDLSLLVLPPTHEERISCIKYYLGFRPHDISDEDISDLALKTENFTPAMIKDAIERASFNAVLDEQSVLTTKYIIDVLPSYDTACKKMIEQVEKYIKIYNTLPNADTHYLDALHTSNIETNVQSDYSIY